MDRLTYRDKDGMAMMKERGGWKSGGIDRLADYEDSGLEPEEISDAVIAAKLMAKSKIVSCFGVDADHVRELVEAEQDGRLVMLPCKAGSLIYVGRRPAIITRFFGYIRERYFHAVFFDENKGIDIPFEELGKTVFLTREEAEAALSQEGGTREADSV